MSAVLGARYRPVRFGGSLTAHFDHRADGSIHIVSTEPLGDYPRRITDRLIHWANTQPERVLAAKRVDGGEWRHLTYAQALRGARSIAQGLLDLGVSVERPVAILSDNDLEHLLLSLGALIAGVPFAPISPAYSLVSQDHAKLRHVLGLLTPGIVFAGDARYAKAIEAAVPAATPVVLTRGAIEGRSTLAFEQLLQTQATAAVDAAHDAVGPDTITKFLFTSGSTKLPKGVINTQRMWCSNLQMLRQCFPFLADEAPVLVDWLPWNHTFGGNHNVGLVLDNGGTLYIDEGRPTPGGIGETLRNLREISPTLYFNVPKGFEEIANAMQADAPLRESLLRRVKMLFFAGAGLSQPVWDKLDALAEAAVGERIRMITGLGMTETAPFALCANGELGGAGAVGLPAPGLQVKLVEVDGKLEVRYRGPNVTPGYWRAPEQTREAFDDEGYFRSGDALRFADLARPGLGLRFDGRTAEDFKLGTGTFVSVGTLRAKIIAEGYPLVQDVVITGANRDDVGALVFPRIDDCRRLASLAADASVPELLQHPAVREFFQTLADRLWQQGTGSASRIARLHALADAPSIDKGEITDKGSINQRAVLAQRAAIVDALYERADGKVDVIVPRR